MGCNFYFRGFRDDDSPEHHIGKRSAAGWYCWDCGITLCTVPGKEHYSVPWHDACPKCGKKPEKERLSEGAAGRELGFNDDKPAPKTGVKSCASFTWGMSEERYNELMTSSAGACPTCGEVFKDKDKIIEDEYGDLFTLAEFREILSECPIQYDDMRTTTFC